MSERRVRVATTRDEAAGGPLAEALARWGMEPVRCATIAHVPPLDPGPLERAARELERYDWLIVASARAVAALAVARGGRPLPSGLRTAAVGAKTAARLEAHGAVSPLIPRAAGAAALLVALRAADEWRDRRVLMPRAAEGGREIARALGGRGAVVDEVVAYRTIERPPDEIASAWRAAAPEAVVVASPSAARALVRALGTEPLRRLEPVVAIGSKTAMALMALGVRAMVPPRADFEAVAALLARATGWQAPGAAVPERRRS